MRAKKIPEVGGRNVADMAKQLEKAMQVGGDGDDWSAVKNGSRVLKRIWCLSIVRWA